MEKSKKFFIYLGAGVMASLMIGGVYYLYKNYNQIELNEVLDKFTLDTYNLLEKNKNKISLEIAARINNLYIEIDDYFFNLDNPDLVEKRRSYIENQYLYKNYCYYTFEERVSSLNKAKDYIESKLNVKLSEIDKILSEETNKNESGDEDSINLYEKLIAENKFIYPENELPIVDSDTLIEAFKFNSLNRSKFQKNNERFKYFRIDTDIEKLEVLKEIIESDTRIQDLLYNKYKIEEKYLVQLIFHHNLEDFPEVKFFLENLYYYDKYKSLKNSQNNKTI